MPPARRVNDPDDRLNKRYTEVLLGYLSGDNAFPRERYQDYFAKLDLESDRRLIPWYLEDKYRARARKQAVTFMLAVLRSRLVDRIDRLRTGRSTVLAPMNERYAVPCARQLSRMQLGLVRECFPSTNGDFDLDEYEDAFEMFSNGELRRYLTSVKKRSCEASSGYYFFFAEFALSAIESEINAPEWRSLAPVMVRCQRMLDRVYEMNGFGKGQFKKEAAMLTKSEKAKLAREFGQDTPLSYLCTAHAKNAMRIGLGAPVRPGTTDAGPAEPLTAEE